MKEPECKMALLDRLKCVLIYICVTESQYFDDEKSKIFLKENECLDNNNFNLTGNNYTLKNTEIF